MLRPAVGPVHITNANEQEHTAVERLTAYKMKLKRNLKITAVQRQYNIRTFNQKPIFKKFRFVCEHLTEVLTTCWDKASLRNGNIIIQGLNIRINTKI